MLDSCGFGREGSARQSDCSLEKLDIDSGILYNENSLLSNWGSNCHASIRSVLLEIWRLT